MANTEERKLRRLRLRRFKTVWLAASAAVAGAALGVTVVSLPASGRSELFPEPGVLRYRFIAAARQDAPDVRAHQLALEARNRPNAARPLDALELAELADLTFKRALSSGDQTAFAEAERLARRSLEIVSWPNSATLTLAKVASARHDFREGIRLAHESLARKRSAAALSVLVTAHLSLGELGAASEAANEAVALHPESATHLARALVLQAQGRDAEAAADFAQAVALEDFGMQEESAKMRAYWGRFLMSRGELHGARLLFDEALGIVPNHALTLDLRGELALRLGEWKQAAQFFRRAFEASKQLRYLLDEARALELEGDGGGAAALRSQVERIVRVELEQGQSGHELELVETLAARGEPQDLREAVELGRAEVSRRPSAEVRFQLAKALVRTGQLAEAHQHVQLALQSGVRDAQVYELAALLEGALGSARRADVYRRLAVSLDPGGSGWRSRGLTVGRVGEVARHASASR